MERLGVYKKWLLNEILQENQHNTLVIQPVTNQMVNYREEPPE